MNRRKKTSGTRRLSLGPKNTFQWCFGDNFCRFSHPILETIGNFYFYLNIYIYKFYYVWYFWEIFSSFFFWYHKIEKITMLTHIPQLHAAVGLPLEQVGHHP
jgi:hypothetical protein